MNTNEKLADWVTTSEAAEIAGCTYDGILKRISRGRIEAIRFGGVWMVRRSSIAPKDKFKTGRPPAGER